MSAKEQALHKDSALVYISDGQQKNFKFYSELVLVAVLSFVAATLWVNAIYDFRKKFLPKTLIIDFIFASIITLASIYLLTYQFKDPKSKIKENNSNNNG
jgi:predicted tellurium resistance membrane protein TerC